MRPGSSRPSSLQLPGEACQVKAPVVVPIICSEPMALGLAERSTTPGGRRSPRHCPPAGVPLAWRGCSTEVLRQPPRGPTANLTPRDHRLPVLVGERRGEVKPAARPPTGSGPKKAPGPREPSSGSGSAPGRGGSGAGPRPGARRCREAPCPSRPRWRRQRPARRAPLRWLFRLPLWPLQPLRNALLLPRAWHRWPSVRRSRRRPSASGRKQQGCSWPWCLP